MAEKSRTREITIVGKTGAIESWFTKASTSKSSYDFEGLTALRRVLGNEKIRMLNVIKAKKPSSLYELSKILGRDFKSVKEDIKLLERFGFIDMLSEKTGKRLRHRPKLAVGSINIKIKI